MKEAANSQAPKRRFHFLRTLFLLIVLALIGGFGYLMLQKSEDEDLLKAIPADAVFVIETSDLSDGWMELSSSNQWKYLLSNEYFSFINEDANWMDSVIRNNSVLSRMMQNRRLLVSAHLLPDNNYDFIFAVDLKSAAKFGLLGELLSTELHVTGKQIHKREFNGSQIIEVVTLSDTATLSLCIKSNILIASYSSALIEASLMHLEEGNLSGEQHFVALRSSLGQRSLFRFYFNYRMLDPYLRVFFTQPDPMAKTAGEALEYSGFEVTLKDERLRLDGFTLVDSLAPYLKALAQVKPGKSRVESVLSERTAMYLSMSFDSYPEFFTMLQSEMKKEDSTQEAAYEKNIVRLRKYFKIDLENDFFSWIGNEIAYVKMQPSADTKEKDFVVALHAGNIKHAREGMDRIVRKIENRTPWKVNNIEYNGYEIRFFKIKGFFKLFFGRLFGKLEEPYFIYLDDYVVFSNSPSTLIAMIDDYKQALTLEHRYEFMDFRQEFNTKANVSIFVRTPKVYNHLYYYANRKNKGGIESNKDLILSYSRIGMQMIAFDGKFRTLLIADHEGQGDILQNEFFDETAENLFIGEYELLDFKMMLSREELMSDGFIRKYYSDSVLMANGMVMNGTQSGLWTNYFPSGNISSSVIYYEGRAHGGAIFYYDSPGSPKKAELLFDNDRIIGAYREYFLNGTLKALLEYRDGKPDGDAEFYYLSGKLKIKGQYSKGEKSGRWKFYSELGDVIEKEVWR